MVRGPESGIELFKTLQDQLIATNDPRDAERAGLIEVMLEARGEDLIYHPQRVLEATITEVTEQTASTAPDLFSKIYPEITLSEEHQRQGLILAERFAARLSMSEEDYIAALPQFPESPANYSALGLNVPIIVETRVSWREAAELSGIFVTDYLKERANAGEVVNWEDDKFEMPQVPFSAWAQNGTKFVYRKPSDVREDLLSGKENKDYRAGRILDSIATWNVRPDIVQTMFWDIIGTKVGSDRVPVLVRWVVRPRLSAFLVGHAFPRCRALVLGREIRTLELAA